MTRIGRAAVARDRCSRDAGPTAPADRGGCGAASAEVVSRQGAPEEGQHMQRARLMPGRKRRQVDRQRPRPAQKDYLGSCGRVRDTGKVEDRVLEAGPQHCRATARDDGERIGA